MKLRAVSAAFAVLALLPAPLAAEADLSLEQRMVLRCSAAFAIVAHGQSTGNAEALGWPPIEERGREYFVRVMARLMDERGMSREDIAAIVGQEAQSLWDNGEVAAIMPSCLATLEASGL